MRSGARSRWGVALALLLAAGTAAAQQAAGDLTDALALERQGRNQEAAAAFGRALGTDRTNLAALFGLERALRAVGELDQLIPYIDSCLAVAPHLSLAWGMRVRVVGELGRSDDLAATVRSWIAAEPQSPDPYREWAFALAQQGNAGQALDVLHEGQQRLGGSALMQELAQMEGVLGQWTEAAVHWRAAAAAGSDLVLAAGVSLGAVPEADRSAVLRVLLEPPDPVARRIAADALVGWDRPAEAWTLLDANLPDEPTVAVAMLRRFVDRVRMSNSVDGARVRGYAWERLAVLQRGPAAQASRVEAGRAFADAGDRAGAERMLDQVARDPNAVPATARGVMVTLISVLADAGRAAEAERRLADWGDRIPAEDRADLAERIAWAWVRSGSLEKAEHALGADSSVATAALRGWIALYRGDLAGAGARFREAGPYAGAREEATRRTAAVALIQRVPTPSSTDLGAGFLALEQGDTASAVGAFEHAARRLSPAGGRGDVLAFAGQLAAAVHDRRAADLLEAALAADSAGPSAPAAEYALAEVLAAAGKVPEALARLEHLILSQPSSAVIPLARRLRDRLRGAVPSS
jgi:tetratricopeptide (TPR) repeat protein